MAQGKAFVAHAFADRIRRATADDRHFKRHFRRGGWEPTLTVAMKPEVEQEPISDR
jgi:hypothetical protein